MATTEVSQWIDAGVGSTPGFFVNGVFISGAQLAAELQKLIDNELKAAKNATAARASR